MSSVTFGHERVDALTPVLPIPLDVSSFNDDNGKIPVIVWSYNSIVLAALDPTAYAVWSLLALLRRTNDDHHCSAVRRTSKCVERVSNFIRSSQRREGGDTEDCQNRSFVPCPIVFFTDLRPCSRVHSMGVLCRRAAHAYGLGALMAAGGLAGPLESLTRERWVPLDSTATDQVRLAGNEPFFDDPK